MSRDSSHTYVHMHSSHHADLFEEFCHPPSASNQPSSNGNNTSNTGANGNNSGDSSMTQIPGYFLPFEEIQLPPHLMPLNPEDEDDVVPDMHAAFGIQRALGQGGMQTTGEGSGRGAHQEPAWRDLGLEKLLNGNGSRKGVESTGARREGKKTGMLLMR